MLILHSIKMKIQFLKEDYLMGRKIRDLTNQRFGKLVALKPTKQRLRKSVVCDCGKTALVSASRLLFGNVRSCGCSPQQRHSNKRRWFAAFGPTGQIVVEKSQTNFAKKIGVSKQAISLCLCNQLESARGWKFHRFQKVEDIRDWPYLVHRLGRPE